METLGDEIGGRYRVLGPLGRGGMGVVVRAEHMALRRVVALKLLDHHFAGSDMERRFEREARTAARLDHPGCVRIFDHGRASSGQLFLAMELITGPTLGAWSRRAGPLPVAALVAVGRELLAALAYAHDEAVLHRDLKPDNVMLARRGQHHRLVLIDFGLARLRDEAGITQAGTVMGSPSYVAPERLRGEPGDERADLYGAAMVLWELAVKRPPFGTGTPLEIALRHLSQPVVPLSLLRPDLPGALAAVIEVGLATRADERWASAQEMLAAFDAAARAGVGAEPGADQFAGAI
jgi:serine/threonine-protein kinase